MERIAAVGGGGDDFENNPISRQGGTRISSPRPVSNIEWTKLKKKKKEKEKERGEKRERERLKSKRDTCVSGIEREGEISISNRQQHAEGKLDLRCAAFEARQGTGWGKVTEAGVAGHAVSLGVYLVQVVARCLTPNLASHLSKILRLVDFLGY